MSKTNIWSRWYMIVLYCFVGLALIGGIFGDGEVKQVEVIKEVIVEVPVEVIREVEVIKEVQVKETTNVPNYKSIIKEDCSDDWDDDFSMVAYCIDRQEDSYDELQDIQPNDLPNSIFNTIKSDCEDDWNNDFSMVVYCIDRQIDGWRAIQ